MRNGGPGSIGVVFSDGKQEFVAIPNRNRPMEFGLGQFCVRRQASYCRTLCSHGQERGCSVTRVFYMEAINPHRLTPDRKREKAGCVSQSPARKA